MTYADAIRFLFSLRWFGAKFGLANSFKLAALAGNPQSRLRFIHVAGTNGKGSTCAMLESIYRAARLRVGLFTSPHLVAFGERIQVNRRVIPEGNVAHLAAEMRSLLEEGWGAHGIGPRTVPGRSTPGQDGRVGKAGGGGRGGAPPRAPPGRRQEEKGGVPETGGGRGGGGARGNRGRPGPRRA